MTYTGDMSCASANRHPSVRQRTCYLSWQRHLLLCDSEECERDRMRGGEAVRTPLWEWSVARDVVGGSVGISMTRHHATEALSKTLISAGFPSTGWVAQVKLIRLD